VRAQSYASLWRREAKTKSSLFPLGLRVSVINRGLRPDSPQGTHLLDGSALARTVSITSLIGCRGAVNEKNAPRGRFREQKANHNRKPRSFEPGSSGPRAWGKEQPGPIVSAPGLEL
jgi:hypothetical protein